MFTLKVKTLTSRWHDHYFSTEDLFVAIDNIVSVAEITGSYVTFSGTDKCVPVDSSETVLTVIRGDVILRPVSAGGTWEGWDEYRRNKTH
jgi:hypothetical protein